VKAGFSHFMWTCVYLAVFFALSPYGSTDYITSDEFLYGKSFFYKLAYLYIFLVWGCFCLFVPFSMFNHSCAATGINYNGVDKNGN
jgi:hypothetical protein